MIVEAERSAFFHNPSTSSQLWLDSNVFDAAALLSCLDLL